MRQKERDRRKMVVYEAYMVGQSKGQKTEVILEELGKKFHRNPRTIQNWIYDVDKRRKSTQQKNLTNEDIVVEEEQRQLVLKHQEDLRTVANQWKSQIWLPPPWRWDVANLRHVTYLDSTNHKTGSKLPEELVSSEESSGHGRAFIESERSVSWDILKNGTITLKTPAEDEPLFGHLKSHTQKLPAWTQFAEWKEKGGIYIQLCSSLLAKIEQDAKETIGAKSELSWWSIYHDAFCLKDTEYRCGICGADNTAESRFCQGCRLPLGWLGPFLKGYKYFSTDAQSSTIQIEGWANIEVSVEIEHYESYIRGHADLRDKYRGCDLVKSILEAERKVNEVQVRLSSEVSALSEQSIFRGECPACTLNGRYP